MSWNFLVLWALVSEGVLRCRASQQCFESWAERWYLNCRKICDSSNRGNKNH